MTAAATAGARPAAGHLRFACGHELVVGYGPGRESEEPCRACLEAQGAIGETEAKPHYRGSRAFLETLPDVDDEGRPRRVPRRSPRPDASEILRGVLMRAIRNAVTALEAGLARVEKKLAGRDELVRERDTIKGLLEKMRPLVSELPAPVRRGPRKGK